MKFAAIAALFAFLPILGVAYIVLSGSLFTVDGLFMILILLTISGVFGLEAVLELRGGRLVTTDGATGARAFAGGAPQQPGVTTEKGLVRDLQFFEAAVGAMNKTIVEFQPDGAKSARFVTFIGNIRDQLPVGSKVRVSYRTEPDGNVLLARDFIRF
jgi:hypothetical protein